MVCQCYYYVINRKVINKTKMVIEIIDTKCIAKRVLVELTAVSSRATEKCLFLCICVRELVLITASRGVVIDGHPITISYLWYPVRACG